MYKINPAEIIAFKIGDPLPFEWMNKKLNTLPDNERQRILRFHKLEDQQRTLLGHLAIRNLLQDKLTIPVHSLSIIRDQYGRPYLDPSHGFEIDFNLSHSGKWILTAMTAAGKIGVDVEEIKSIDLSVAKLCFTQEEMNFFQMIHPDEQLPFFFSIWTLKEAYVKAIGKGLLCPMDGFGFNMEDWSQNKLTLRTSLHSYHSFHFKLFQIEKNYVAAVCSTESEPIQHVKVMDRSVFL
ncbi:4-phosphopantetheinyl transferase [Bacillus sp. SA1-12]|uniref:4'-phosphopantetheinyl transferase family protein n=1 Tax=Bacillus sp. SA1-12 TaxID=1455638 RepID=UPI0006272F0B|nr:4'-phosphopantetheinyl transferase superfamily protein [Bacillus sp. SA1-12]KKI89721.1 4-phosphopantetheinyl transferase [Bacillus sp. SA1-12]